MSRQASDVKILDRFFGLFIGDPGCGKSMAAFSFPGPIYCFDVDGRMRSAVKHFGLADQTILESITFDQHKNLDAFATQLENFQDRCPYKTVIIDSITTLAQLIIRSVLKSKGGLSLLRDTRAGKKDGREGARRIGGIIAPGIEEFMAEQQAFNEIIALCAGLRCHVIFTGHTTDRTVIPEKGDPDQSKTRRTLLTAGKTVAAMIPVSFDEVWNFNTEGNLAGDRSYNFRTVDHAGDIGKTSMHLPPKIDWTRKDDKLPVSATNGGVYQKIVKLLGKDIEGPLVNTDTEIAAAVEAQSRVQSIG
tara:strand:+ start:144 stop:1055 length:912 start_codon:yes stop_codon:yes gene_type:complete